MEAERIFVVAPAVIMRPAGYNLHPEDKGYATSIPLERQPYAGNRYREIQSWQFNTKKERV